jgi:predicted Zn-dependent protease
MPIDVYGGDSHVSWAELGGRDLERTAIRRTPSEKIRKRDAGKGDMIAAYGRALKLLASGDEVAARRELADIEDRVMATRSPNRIRQLRSTEIRRAMQLATSDPDTVLGVVLFHRDMYRWYAARRRTVLASHSWQVVTEVMDQVARVQDGLPIAGFREAVMLDQASDLAREGDIAGARRLLEQLVGIAPDNTQGRLGLAALCERTGDPTGAVENLQALLENRPDHPEAQLRLAVNQSRVGADRTARRHLRELLAQQTPLWIRTLVYQELGRSLVQTGRLDEGERLLRAAVEELPRNQRLRILHAYSLDVQQRPWEATEVIKELDSRGGQQSTSPRLLYSQWPDLDLESARAILSRAQEVGLRALHGVLQ